MPPPPSPDGLAARLLLGPALRAQPDRRLVTLVREGYEAAFEEIVRRYGKPLNRYAAAIVGGRAEDVTQDAFSKALLALRRDEREIQLRPWLYRIVRNTALNEIRDRPPPAEVLEEAIESGTGPEQVAERRAEISDLMKRLRALPEPQRAAIVMRELEGLSHEEIAAALGLSDGAARQAIYRARQALRDGAAMLIPLPLVRMLFEHGPETAAAAGAGGAALAGVGTAAKVGAVTVLVAGSVGAGVAFEQRSDPEPARAESKIVSSPATAATPSESVDAAGGQRRQEPADAAAEGRGDDRSRDEGKPAQSRPERVVDFRPLRPFRKGRQRGPGGLGGPGGRDGPGRFRPGDFRDGPRHGGRLGDRSGPGGGGFLDDGHREIDRPRDREIDRPRDREIDSGGGEGQTAPPPPTVEETDRSGTGDGNRTTDSGGASTNSLEGTDSGAGSEIP